MVIRSNMKLVSISGCICDSLTIDGKESVELPIEDIKAAIKKAVDKISDIGTLQQTLINLIESQGNYEDLGTCEQCGDWITKYTLNV
mgnify:CR=1 FL=1